MTTGKLSAKLRSGQVRGFSLLEVLIAFALSAVVLGGLSSISGTLLRSWDRSTVLLEDQSAIFNAVERLAEEISGSIPFHAYESASQPKDGPRLAVFTGLPDQTTFVRPAIGFETRHDLDRVTYSLEQNGSAILLVRRSQRVFGADITETSQPVTRTVVAEFEGFLLFEYFNGTSFVDQWSNGFVRPKGVRIRFGLKAFPDRTFTKTAITYSEVGPICLLAKNANVGDSVHTKTIENCDNYLNARP